MLLSTLSVEIGILSLVASATLPQRKESIQRMRGVKMLIENIVPSSQQVLIRRVPSDSSCAMRTYSPAPQYVLAFQDTLMQQSYATQTLLKRLSSLRAFY